MWDIRFRSEQRSSTVSTMHNTAGVNDHIHQDPVTADRSILLLSASYCLERHAQVHCSVKQPTQEDEGKKRRLIILFVSEQSGNYHNTTQLIRKR